MSGCLASLAKWFRLPTRGGFAALDIQIAKLRMLRDSYQEPTQDFHTDLIADVNKDRGCC